MSKVKNVSPILQMEATECGAASLAMILKYHGENVSLKQLRHECGVSRNGVNAKKIIKAAQAHNLSVRVLRAEPDALAAVQLPAIIHWNMDHFLVLCGFSKKGVVLVDPAYGKRTVSYEAFSASFTGVVLECSPTAVFTKTKKSDTYHFIDNCIKSCAMYNPCLVIADLCILFASIALPLLNSVYIDKIIVRGNFENLRTLIITNIWAGLIILVGLVLVIHMRHTVSKQLNQNINFGFIKRLMKLPIEFYSQRSASELAGRHNANMTMGMSIVMLLSPIASYIMQAIAYLSIILFLGVDIAIIGIVFALINVAVIVYNSNKYKDHMRSFHHDFSVLRANLSHAIALIETIKSCGCEDGILRKLLASGTRVINSKTVINKTNTASNALTMILCLTAPMVVLVVGIWKVMNGSITAGILIALQSLIALMLDPVINIVNAEISMQTLKNDIEHTDDAMNYDCDNKFLDETKEQESGIAGGIALSHVDFAYNSLDDPFVVDFNLEIEKGSCVALTGRSNSGKSTVAKIIAGLHRETAGDVTFGGVKRADIDQHYFYSKVAVVSQAVRLFEGTIFDNITMWDDAIPYNVAVAAAKAACIHEDIIVRQGGYRGPVLENGKNFSGGQRQRIEIARAIAKTPEILILDEATSALDADTEAEVMRNIKAMGITCILVAHRLSTIRDSDTIVVLEQGAIVEQGKHEELMQLEGRYYSLVKA